MNIKLKCWLRKKINKDENAHRFALSAIRGEILEREREKERERKKDREKKREKERKKERERERDNNNY